MKFQLILIFALLILIFFCFASYSAEEIPVLAWEKTFGGSNLDILFSIIQTEDGGYAVSGYTRSKGKGKADSWIIKLDEWGNMVWDNTFGRSENDVAHSIIQTKDGGYAVSGYTTFKKIGEADLYIIKLDEKGNKIWDKIFFELNWDCANSIIQTKDEGYVISGYTWSKGAGKADAWVIRLNNEGNMVWNKTFGGSNNDEAHSIIQTKDGNYIIVGKTQSKGSGKWDAWIIKLDEWGNAKWDKTFGGTDNDCVYSVMQTKDEGYVISGYTRSKGAGKADVWIIKLNNEGDMVWDKTFGGNDDDIAKSIIQAENGDYLIAGETLSKGAGKWDAWIIKLDDKGNFKWDKTIGGSSWDSILSIIQTEERDFIVTGWTMSKGAGEADAWVIKFNEKGD